MSVSEAEFEAIRDRMATNRRKPDPWIANAFSAAAPAPKCGKAKRGANKWEQMYGEKLAAQQRMGMVLWYQFEGMRFRLADGAYYKPDYVAMNCKGELIAIEVKGFWREAARVRIKVAADRFPVRFIAVRRKLVKEGGGWEEEIFSAMFDRTPIGEKA